MKSKKVLVLVLTICLFVGSVGLVIHVAHRNTQAQQAGHTIICVWRDSENREVGMDVTIKVWDGATWQTASGETNANGEFFNSTLIPAAAADRWIAVFEEDGWQLWEDGPLAPVSVEVFYDEQSHLFQCQEIE